MDCEGEEEGGGEVGVERVESEVELGRLVVGGDAGEDGGGEAGGVGELDWPVGDEDVGGEDAKEEDEGEERRCKCADTRCYILIDATRARGLLATSPSRSTPRSTRHSRLNPTVLHVLTV